MSSVIPAALLRRLMEGAATVTGQTRLRDVLLTTVEAAMNVTGARYGALGVIGEHGTLVEFVYLGLDHRQAERIGAPPTGRGVLGTIIRMAKTVRIDRIADHPDSVGFPEHHPPMETFLGVPIHVGREVYGNLYLTEKEGGFTADDEVTVEALAVIAGSAVATTRLQERLRRLAVVEDRERIARDVHDAIIQDLFAVGLSLQALSLQIDDEPVAGALQAAATKLDGTIASLRSFIFDLRPINDEAADLETDARALIGNLAAPHDARVQLEVDPALGVLDGDLVEDALAVIAEAVSNALRHAQAGLIEVQVDQVGRSLRVEVRDDGDGFDPEAVGEGLGLDNLRNRAVRAGGTASITSQPGSGTTVEVLFPL